MPRDDFNKVRVYTCRHCGRVAVRPLHGVVWACLCGARLEQSPFVIDDRGRMDAEQEAREREEGR